ncbi:YsnF/AvaK domain-containing protein [Dankookia rubra]|nr:YsnF/AvaK domain-containing protein [Dankookia rubra]
MAEPDPSGRLIDEKVVPVIEETAVVYKERVVTDRVRLHKRVQTTQEVLDIPVQTESLEVERVPIGAWIEAPAGIRHEGNTTIYPVVEEVLVVEKRLRLVEEVRITRRRDTRQVREKVSLRHEEILVERDAPPDGPDRDPGP